MARNIKIHERPLTRYDAFNGRASEICINARVRTHTRARCPRYDEKEEKPRAHCAKSKIRSRCKYKM